MVSSLRSGRIPPRPIWMSNLEDAGHAPRFRQAIDSKGTSSEISEKPRRITFLKLPSLGYKADGVIWSAERLPGGKQ